jgi:CheY-like chemotaxis protein
MEILDSVLLVDDDEISTQFHESLIKQLKLTRHIISKKNGKEAFEFIRNKYDSNRQLPTLILTDLSMPVMDGFDFIRKVRGSDLLGVKKIPIAIVSASEMEKDKKILEELGTPLFVQKPLDKVKFLHILDSTIVPLLSPEHQRIIIERQKVLEKQKLHLMQENEVLKKSPENIKRAKQHLGEKFFKYRNSY